MNDLEERAATEATRLRSLLFNCGISENCIELLSTTIDNTAWMKIKLDVTREKIKNTDVAIPYDNGGGQSGIRENPLFKGYENLFKTYMSGMRQLLDMLPEAAQNVKKEEIEKPKTMLELVRDKHRKDA